jgi:hypothetical protein
MGKIGENVGLSRKTLEMCGIAAANVNLVGVELQNTGNSGIQAILLCWFNESQPYHLIPKNTERLRVWLQSCN